MKQEKQTDWILVRDKLREIARLIIQDSKVEAAFLLGCLHEICNENIETMEQTQKQSVCY